MSSQASVVTHKFHSQLKLEPNADNGRGEAPVSPHMKLSIFIYSQHSVFVIRDAL